MWTLSNKKKQMGLASKLKALNQPGQQVRAEEYLPQQQYSSLSEDFHYDSLNYNSSSYQSIGTTEPPLPPIPHQHTNTKPTLQPRTDMVKIKSHIKNIIKLNRLERFYSSNQLKTLLERINTIDFESLAAQWKISVEMAYDFCSLGLYDIAVFVDDSGSMRFEDNGARIQEMTRILSRIAQITTLFDDDGILIRFMNNNTEGNGIRNATETDQLMKTVSYLGMTPIGTKLEQKLLEPFVYEPIRNGTFTKPIVVYVITDGDPSGEQPNKIFDVISHAKSTLEGANMGKGVAFAFAQVGRDLLAQQFLSKLDNHTAIGGIVDTTSYFELEAEEYAKKGIELSPELWTLKLMLGAVDPSYDEQDE
jgi:hypothetical protein